MTPELIFGIAVGIIALLVLVAMLFHSLNNVDGKNTMSVIALFVLLCILILTSATFFGEHVDITNAKNKTERLRE